MLYNLLQHLYFRGVITVDVKLDELDINQCPADFYIPNAFKNTAKCDFQSQYVSIINVMSTLLTWSLKYSTWSLKYSEKDVSNTR